MVAFRVEEVVDDSYRLIDCSRLDITNSLLSQPYLDCLFKEIYSMLLLIDKACFKVLSLMIRFGLDNTIDNEIDSNQTTKVNM